MIEEKYNLIVDVCEPKQIFNLAEKHKDLNPQLEDLRKDGAGDYILGGDTLSFIIERKTWGDLIRSIKDGSIWDQIVKIKHHDNCRPLLLIEGYRYQALKYSKFSHQQLNGVLNGISMGFKIPIVYTISKKDTVRFLAKISVDIVGGLKQTYHTIRTKGLKGKSLSYQQRFIVEGFPGYGPKKANDLLLKQQTLHNALTEIMHNEKYRNLLWNFYKEKEV